MQTLSLQRLEKNRPAINIFTKNGKDPALFHEALLDTGAVFPVFTKGSAVLTSLGGVLKKENVSFNGFGGEVNADLYEISIFLGDDNGSIIFPNMSILCIDDPTIGFPFVLSATMFEEFDYTISNSYHRVLFETDSNQVCYNFIIKDQNGKLHVFLNKALDDKQNMDISWLTELLQQRNS